MLPVVVEASRRHQHPVVEVEANYKAAPQAAHPPPRGPEPPGPLRPLRPLPAQGEHAPNG